MAGEQLSASLFNVFMENLVTVFLPVWACIGLLLVVRATVVWQKSVDKILYYIIATSIIFSAWVGWRSDSVSAGLATLAACFIVTVAVAVNYRHLRNQQLTIGGISRIDTMSAAEFELFLLAYFEKAGYRGSTTVKGNNYGADLVLSKDELKTVVRAKRWDSRVGAAEIEEIAGAVRHYGADIGMVVATNSFTSHAKKVASSNNIELWDRDTLIRVMLEATADGEPIATEQLSVGTTARACPKCGDMMIARQGKYGKFWGCESYPKCRHTEAFGRY